MGSVNEPNFILFHQWLQNLKATHLFLMGDIFDLWIGEHEYFKDKYKLIIDELIRLAKEGTKIHYFEGNHDLYLKSYWQNELGFKVHEQAEYFQLGKWVIRAEHGDQVDPEDRGYIFLRWFLRTRFMRFIAKNLPQSLVVKIGEKASESSRHYTSEVKSITTEKTREKLHIHAEKAYKEKAFDWLIYGHVHVKDEYYIQVGDKKVGAFNLGTWLKEPLVFCLEDSGGYLSKVSGLGTTTST